ncbi:MAG: response regulator [Pseudomonadota bacterium]
MKLCLVVDDYEVIRKVVRRTVEELGFIVIEAATCEEAAAQCANEMPHLILVDWRLPDGGSLELITSIRAEPCNHIPVIVYLPTENDVEDISRALHAGANDYLQKPFDREVMQTKINELMPGTHFAAMAEFEPI